MNLPKLRALIIPAATLTTAVGMARPIAGESFMMRIVDMHRNRNGANDADVHSRVG